MHSRVLILLSSVLVVMISIIATLWSRPDHSRKVSEEEPATLPGLDHEQPTTTLAAATDPADRLDVDPVDGIAQSLAQSLTERVRVYHQLHGNFPSAEHFWAELGIKPIPNPHWNGASSVVRDDDKHADENADPVGWFYKPATGVVYSPLDVNGSDPGN